MHSMVALQRPGDVPVRIIVEGDAAWLPVAGGNERRGAVLVFRSDDELEAVGDLR